MQKFKIGQKVYQQGNFDIFECVIVEYIPNHLDFAGSGEEMGGWHPVYVEAYRVKYEDGTTAIVNAYDLGKTTKDMYQV